MNIEDKTAVIRWFTLFGYAIFSASLMKLRLANLLGGISNSLYVPHACFTEQNKVDYVFHGSLN
jgi:hypothetical protein